MPYFLHQWRYKDQQVKEMLLGAAARDRAEIVRTAVQAFGGTLHQFFYSFGEYDGVAVTDFADHETAMACVTTIFAQGRIEQVRTTSLFTSEQMLKVMSVAEEVFKAGAPR